MQLPKGKMYHPKEKWYNIPIIHQYDRLKPVQGEIGMEIECEGMNLFSTPISYWMASVDHSLREYEGHKPIEYVLKKPVSRKEVDAALTYLIEKLEGNKSFVAESTRTSVHVHINCQNLTMKQVTTFVCLWMIFENLLTEFCGPGRIGNLFCLRAKDAEGFVMAYEEALRSEGNVREELFNENYRYYGCNMASVGKYGSVEFRTMRGTVDPKLIRLWVDLLCHLKDVSLWYEDPQAVVKDFESSRPDAFLKLVIPAKFMEAIKQDGYHQKMWEGARLMRDIAYALREWEPAKPLVDIVMPKYRPDDIRGTAIFHNPLNHAVGVSSPIWGSLSVDRGRTVFEKKVLKQAIKVLITRPLNDGSYVIEFDSNYNVLENYQPGQYHADAVKELVSADAPATQPVLACPDDDNDQMETCTFDELYGDDDDAF